MKLTIYPDNIELEVTSGAKLMDIAKENNIEITTEPCGNGVCGKCKVIVNEGNTSPLTIKERKVLTEEEIEAGVRLACSFKMMEDTKVFRVNAKVLEEEKEVTKTFASDNGRYGIIADIGTTNVVCGLYDLSKTMDTQEENLLETANPQKIMGMEIVGRIAFANNEKKLGQMQKMVTGCVNNLINRLTSEDKSINKKNIKKIVICGNTTMIHMFLGKDVTGLGVYPFSTGYMGGEVLSAKEFINGVSEDAKLYVPPFIGGHVGSDALCCLYGSEREKSENRDKAKLIVDMGTNAEIILCNKDKVSACSAAAGPAFEGMGLRYGSKYIDGSVCSAKLAKDNILEYEIKGTGIIREDEESMSSAKSICASGMIDILSILRKCGDVDFFGTFKEKDTTLKGVDKEHPCFYLSKENTRVCISQADVRNIQLAKSAVLSGILTLLDTENVSLEEVDEIVLTGAFGNGINVANAMDIKLLPKIEESKYVFAKDLVLKGAKEIIYGDSDKTIEDMIERAKNIRHVELGHIDMFKDIFIDNMNV